MTCVRWILVSLGGASLKDIIFKSLVSSFQFGDPEWHSNCPQNLPVAKRSGGLMNQKGESHESYHSFSRWPA